MTGDCHVRFCERLGAKLPWPTDRARSVGSGAGAPFGQMVSGGDPEPFVKGEDVAT